MLSSRWNREFDYVLLEACAADENNELVKEGSAEPIHSVFQGLGCTQYTCHFWNKCCSMVRDSSDDPGDPTMRKLGLIFLFRSPGAAPGAGEQ